MNSVKRLGRRARAWVRENPEQSKVLGIVLTYYVCYIAAVAVAARSLSSSEGELTWLGLTDAQLKELALS